MSAERAQRTLAATSNRRVVHFLPALRDLSTQQPLERVAHLSEHEHGGGVSQDGDSEPGSVLDVRRRERRAGEDEGDVEAGQGV